MPSRNARFTSAWTLANKLGIAAVTDVKDLYIQIFLRGYYWDSNEQIWKLIDVSSMKRNLPSPQLSHGARGLKA